MGTNPVIERQKEIIEQQNAKIKELEAEIERLNEIIEELKKKSQFYFLFRIIMKLTEEQIKEQIDSVIFRKI